MSSFVIPFIKTITKKLLAFPFVFICIFLICAHKYVASYFSTMTGAEFLFFMQTPMDGADKRLVHIFINKCLLNPFIYSFLICFMPDIIQLLKNICNYRKKLLLRIYRVLCAKYYVLLLILLSLLISGYYLTKFNFIRELWNMDRAPYGTFFEKHFTYPEAQNIHLKQKKNLIVISVESLEKTFENKHFFKHSLVPHLEKLEKEGVQFSNYKNGWNTSNTISHVIALFTGLPKSCGYKGLINKHGHKVNFLNGYYALGNYLIDNGYQTYSVQGSDGKFAGQKNFFQNHGIQHTVDAAVIKNKYYPNNTEASQYHSQGTFLPQ